MFAGALRSKTWRAAAAAALLVAAANAWLGARLDALLPEGGGFDVLNELERRVEKHPARSGVTMLVFGDSHAMAGMRPPVLASELHVAPETIFNLGLPSSCSFEQLLLAERYAGRFPAAREALINLDEHFVGICPVSRLKYLTRGGDAERWRYARQATRVDERVGEVIARWFPAIDFGEPLRSAAMRWPQVTLKRLVADVPVQTSDATRYASMAYIGGLPPPWDHAGIFHGGDHVRTAAYFRYRISILMRGRDRVPGGFEQLEALARLLEARGIRVTLVSTGYIPSFRRLLEREAGYQDYRRRLAAYLAASGRHLEAAPDIDDFGCFHDPDHLNARGAHRFAAWLKPRLKPSGSPALGASPAPERSKVG